MCPSVFLVCCRKPHKNLIHGSNFQKTYLHFAFVAREKWAFTQSCLQKSKAPRREGWKCVFIADGLSFLLPAGKWTFIFQCLWSELFPYGQSMHTTAGSGGVSADGKKGPLGPEKADSWAMCWYTCHGVDPGGLWWDKRLWPLSPAAHSRGNWRHLSLVWLGWQLGPYTHSGWRERRPHCWGEPFMASSFPSKACWPASLRSSPSNSVSPVSSSLLPGKVHPFQQPQPLRAPPPPLLPWRTGCYFLDKHWILTFSYWEYPCHTQKSYCKCHAAKEAAGPACKMCQSLRGPRAAHPQMCPMARDYFELKLLKKQPTQEGHPDSLSLWKQDIHLSCERCSPWVWR